MLSAPASSSSMFEAADGLAITMVLLLGFSLGMILTILVVMARNSGRKSDLDAPPGPSPPPGDSPTKANRNGGSKQPWEREADWWKKEDTDP